MEQNEQIWLVYLLPPKLHPLTVIWEGPQQNPCSHQAQVYQVWVKAAIAQQHYRSQLLVFDKHHIP